MQASRTPRRSDAPVGPGSRDSERSTLNSQLPVRRGFTLIELLIVLALIGILAGLLLGGVFQVFGGAHVTQVVAEISSLDKAIQDFKLRFGVEPPSFVQIYEDGPNWGSSVSAKRSRAVVLRIWPDYDFAQRDINGDGDNTDVLTFQSTEALLFFLAGNGILNTANPQPLGFSVNPTNPFATGGQRAGPFHEFDTSRLSDLDADGNPEYRDPIPGQLLPYLYFSSYDGAGYRPFGVDDMPGNADDEILEQGGTDIIASIYMVNDQNWPMTGGRPKASAGEYINAKSFQLISPGADFRFGAGGTYIRGKGLAVFTASPDQYRSTEARQPEHDNITNFSGGVLGETTFPKPAI